MTRTYLSCKKQKLSILTDLIVGDDDDAVVGKRDVFVVAEGRLDCVLLIELDHRRCDELALVGFA